MNRYAVLGQPIAHSLSPRIHPLFAQQVGLALHYEALQVAPEHLAESLKRLHAAGYAGLNLTLPHKIAVMALCETLSDAAQQAGAVNTLVRTATGWNGDNTDGAGFIRDVKRLGFPLRGARVLLLGAGGAARGLLKPLLDEQAASLTLSSRNPWKPEELAIAFKPHGEIRAATHLSLKGDRFDLIINATSAGHEGQAVRIAFPLLADGGACYDLSYGQAHAPFAAWAAGQGATRLADGLGMLVEQAVGSFARWTGQAAAAAPVIATLRQQ